MDGTRWALYVNRPHVPPPPAPSTATYRRFSSTPVASSTATPIDKQTCFAWNKTEGCLIDNCPRIHECKKCRRRADHPSYSEACPRKKAKRVTGNQQDTPNGIPNNVNSLSGEDGSSVTNPIAGDSASLRLPPSETAGTPPLYFIILTTV